MTITVNPFLKLTAPGLPGLQPYIPGKPLSELERELGITNSIKLASNENPLGPGPLAREAALAALAELGRYPDGGGFELRRVLAERHGLDSAAVTLGNGSNDVLDLVARVFLHPGQESVFSEHAFAVYAIGTQAVGARARVAKARDFGVMSVDLDNRVLSFAEKPDQPDAIPGREGVALASMGIYVFNRGFIYEQLIRDSDMPGSSRDFAKDIIPGVVEKYRVMAYPFRDVRSGEQAYWRDVGTVDAFWQANLELIGVTPPLNLYDSSWPIWTYQEQLPPAKFVFDDEERRGMAVDSMVSGGCIISGAVVRHSLLFSNVRVNSYSYVQDSVILPDVDVGRNCRIHNTVIDRGCRIPEGMKIGLDPDRDRANGLYVTEGAVTLVTPEMLKQEPSYVR